MRLHVLVLLAACGGSAAKPTTTAPTTPVETEEDWRGYLSQIAGTPCDWIPGSSFLACIAPGGEPTTTLIGWEANNRRYVAWRIARDGRVSVMPGSASNAGWLFESPDGTVAFTRAAGGGWTATGLAAADLPVMASPKATPPAPPSPPRTKEDWRSSLEGFAGTWAFAGTEHGAQKTEEVRCAWIPAATFVACTHSGGFELIGWEPHNARYVMYRFAANAIAVLVATRNNRDWTFASHTHRVTYGYESPIRRNYKEEALAGGSWQIVADGSLETGIE